MLSPFWIEGFEYCSHTVTFCIHGHSACPPPRLLWWCSGKCGVIQVSSTMSWYANPYYVYPEQNVILLHPGSCSLLPARQKWCL